MDATTVTEALCVRPEARAGKEEAAETFTRPHEPGAP